VSGSFAQPAAEDPSLAEVFPSAMYRRGNALDRLRSLGGGLRSWLGVRCTSTPALNLTAPPSCGCCAYLWR
jgi:hypothetical protein